MLASQGVHSYIFSFTQRVLMEGHDVPGTGQSLESAVNKATCLALRKLGKDKLEILDEGRGHFEYCQVL